MLKSVLFLTLLTVCFPAFSQSKVPQTMDQINAILKAKKESLEPFSEKDVKIDLESLGLDDLSKTKSAPEEKILKPEESKPLEAKTPESKEVLQEKEEPKIEEKKQVELPAKKEEKKVESAPEKKIEEVKKPDQKPLLKKTKAKKRNANRTSNYINSSKKRDLKNRLEAERKQYVYEKRRAEQAHKLQELRKKYLAEFEEKDSDSNVNEEVFDEEGSEIILPQRKNLSRFISEEPPALPILDHFRTSDNLHIPTILSYEERRNILFDAINIGNINYFNSAYKYIENPDVTNQSGDTILTYAILTQKYAVMAAILARGADPNLPNALGYSPIDIAVELLDIKALEILVQNKADINYFDSFGRTSLMHAARVGFLPAVELLVLKGADVNIMDNDGFTALSIAYRHQKEIIVKFLLKNGAKPWIEKPYEAEKHSLIKELENRWK